LNGIWNGFEDLVFWGKIQRRGVDVNVPKIGSRVGGLCFGGILGIYAELRREFGWGNLDLVNLGFLSSGLTWGWRRGGNLCAIWVWGVDSKVRGALAYGVHGRGFVRCKCSGARGFPTTVLG
jgi:hypothetical protein